MLQSTWRSTTRPENTPNLLSPSSPAALLLRAGVWDTLARLFPAERVQNVFLLIPLAEGILISWSGAAKDKVAALEKAGAIVTDSPAKIGEVMLKVGKVSSSSRMRF